MHLNFNIELASVVSTVKRGLEPIINRKNTITLVRTAGKASAKKSQNCCLHSDVGAELSARTCAFMISKPSRF